MKGILEICIESKVGVGKGREGGAKPSNPVISVLGTRVKNCLFMQGDGKYQLGIVVEEN